MRFRWIVFGGVFLATTFSVYAVERQVPRSAEQVRYSYAPVVQTVTPAVVSIHASRIEKVREFHHPFFGFFHDFPGFDDGFMRKRMERSLGSGTIIRKDGTIITNHHIIRGASEIKIVLADKREYDVDIIVEEPQNDLAILRIKGAKEDFPFLDVGNSDSVEVGDIILAVGNPFGLSHTVTSGIISAVGRTYLAARGQTYIQTDAPINPGNSGGALVSMDGKLIGICTFILSRSGGSEGTGFVIPSNTLKPLLASLDHGGKVMRPWLGVTVQTITQPIAESLGLKRPGGVLVKSILEGSPVKKIGLEPGDSILRVDGLPIGDDESFNARVNASLVGTVLQLDVLKKNGKQVEYSVELIAPPETPVKDLFTLKDDTNPLSGSTFANISPAVATEIQLPLLHEGVVVYKVEAGSPAERLGVSVGDIILKINGKDIKTVSDLRRALKTSSRAWQFLIKRGDQVSSIMFSH